MLRTRFNSYASGAAAFLAFMLCWSDVMEGHGADLPADIKKVVFLGNSITFSGQYVDWIDAYYATRFPDRPLEILNLGLPSETVSGLSEEGHAGGQFPRPNLHERLGRVLEKVKPDLVIACYGMNDGIYLPYDAERFAAFSNGIVRLRKRVLSAGAKIIHVTPPVFDELRGRGPGYSKTLDRYSDWLLGQRIAGWTVVDVHNPMTEVLRNRRTADPAFFLASDGVHAGQLGHWIMARAILMPLGATDVADTTNELAMVRSFAGERAEKLLQLTRERQRILKEAWLTATGHTRPGIAAGLPLPVATEKAVALRKEIRALLRTR